MRSRAYAYDEKTGDPIADNKARNLNRALGRSLRGNLHARARSRRRRAQIVRVEFMRYAETVALVAEDKGLPSYPARLIESLRE